MLQIKTRRLFNALNEYFFVKDQNGGGFSSTAQKDRVTGEILTAALRPATGYKTIAIVPGTIFLGRPHRKRIRHHQVNKQTDYFYRPRSRKAGQS